MRRSTLALILVTTACSAPPQAGTSNPALAQEPVADAGPSGTVTAAGLALGAPPVNGFQIVLPVVAGVEAGTSQEWCTWTEHVLDADIDIKATQAFQTKAGHHIALFYTANKKAPGTSHPCTNDDMATFRYASAGGEGQGEVPLPGNLVVHVPKGMQLVMNHHYLNAGSKPVDAQSALNVRLADPGTPTTRSGAVALLDTSMHAPPGISSFDVRCTMKNDLALWLLQPHMHQWGTHILIETKTDKLVDTAWDESYVFHPPELRRDPQAPYVLRAGEEIHVRCTWDNPTKNDLTFGLEMCVAFGQTVDAKELGNMECNAGVWGPF